MQMGARALTHNGRTRSRTDGCTLIILVLDAEAADARDCFHTLLTGVKGT